MKRNALVLGGLAGALSVAAMLGACSAGNGPSGFLGGVGGAGIDTSVGGGSPSSSAQLNPTMSTGASPNPKGCDAAADEDRDGDGWTREQGDCNDCDPNVNPGAIEVVAVAGDDGGVPDPADENCDGKLDNVLASCDDALALDDTDPMNGARAIGLCQTASADGTKGKAGYAWGVRKAAYVHASGAALADPKFQVGIMPTFGEFVNAQEGKNLLVLSSGHARTFLQPNRCPSDSCSSHAGAGKPPGFPVPVPGCGGGPSTSINDDIALQLDLRAPTNATGYKFQFKFHSFEFPEYVCSTYNDQFVALVAPQPTGSQNGNISFDATMNPVSVNIGFFDVCNPDSGERYTGHNKPDPYCPRGWTELQGTGFDAQPSGNWGGATTWLESQAPITGGEDFQIRFAIWDAGDHALDSTVLIDAFSWIAGAGVAVGTGEVHDPH